ncbi:MAG: hypothetical protein JSR90_13255 [Proteobacteria bacterium]|nr:hypothetical protein [Pseudomonadota bacterium]
MPSKKPPSPDAKRRIDKKLDEALKDTFPASDPVSFVELSPSEEEPKGGAEKR